MLEVSPVDVETVDQEYQQLQQESHTSAPSEANSLATCGVSKLDHAADLRVRRSVL